MPKLASIPGLALLLCFGPGCIDEPVARVPEPRAGSDCPAPTPGAPFRAGELVVVLGYSPDPEFQLTGLVYAVDGSVRFNRDGIAPDTGIPGQFVGFRDVVRAGGHSVTAVADWRRVGSYTGHKIRVVAAHSFDGDGTLALCIDLHLGVKAAPETDIGARPYVHFTEVPLAIPPN